MAVATSSRNAPRRLGLTLFVSFGLTIASFVTATALIDAKARGIGTAAESITTNAVPSIDRMANIRTVLRHLEVTLDDYVDRIAVGGAPDHEEVALRVDRKFLDREWSFYLALPTYPGERDLQPDAASALAGLEASIDQTLDLLHAGDGPGALSSLNQQVKPACDALDERLRLIMGVNARSGAALGNQIMSLRHASRAWAIVLDVLSALFAAFAMLTAFRIVRRYSSLMEHRVGELEQFAGRVAHDIRSPLASVGIVLNLAERERLAPRTLALVSRGTRALQRVGDLVDGLLVFACAGAAPSENAHSPVKEIVEGVLEELHPVAEDRHVDLIATRLDHTEVACSPGVLISIVSNLVGNAIKYMGDVPVRNVMLCTRDGYGKTRIEVQDTGPGISPHAQLRIFDPFVREAGAATIPGLGLGLATVRRLAEAHGGRVGVESHQGAGSLFWVELPNAREQASSG